MTISGGGAYELQVTWCWKETKSQLSKHSKESIVGDPSDCWIKYDAKANQDIEAAFQRNEGIGEYTVMPGYDIDFSAMKQTKKSTGYKREVQRLVEAADRSPNTTTAVWCWKETAVQMSNHAKDSVFGDRADCWIKYDKEANDVLESAYTVQEGSGECAPIKGYIVNFSTMTQKKVATGFLREVQRAEVSSPATKTTSPVLKQEEGGPGWLQKPAADTSTTFSVDLLQLAKLHVTFLQFLHSAGVTTQQVTSESLRRYRYLWLPLIAHSYDDEKMKDSKEELIPPPDVAWLWHCHRLAPSAYHWFIRKEFSKFQGRQDRSILNLQDPKLPYALQTNSYTKNVWEKLYPKEPFMLPPNKSGETVFQGDGNINGYDLFASAKAQAGFLYQVESIQVESRIVDEYRKFLQLACGPTEAFQFVPTNEIDLVWHTHMTGATPDTYKQDCAFICGKLFDHDDSLGEDRSPGGVLDDSFEKTGKLWAKTYGDPNYTKRGGYRGEPPAAFMSINKDVDPESLKPTTATPAVASSSVAETDDDGEKKNTCCGGICSKSMFSAFLCILIAVGLVAMLVPSFSGSDDTNFPDSSYVCGKRPPSAEEIQSRGVPSCLQTNVVSGSLCLRGGEDPNDPPVWCYNNVVDQGSFWLWWSPCTKCGTAWRMDEERDDDKSRYKLPISQPGPGDIPEGGSAWQQWNVGGQDWYDATVTFQQCPGSIDASGVSSSCYAEVESSPKLLSTLGMLVAIFCGATVLWINCDKCTCPQSSGGGGGRSGGGWSGGGGCGGGGGGCGGGGGGCGGC